MGDDEWGHEVVLVFGCIDISLGGTSGDGSEKLDCDISFNESWYVDVPARIAFEEVAVPEECIAVQIGDEE